MYCRARRIYELIGDIGRYRISRKISEISENIGDIGRYRRYWKISEMSEISEVVGHIEKYRRYRDISEDIRDIGRYRRYRKISETWCFGLSPPRFYIRSSALLVVDNEHTPKWFLGWCRYAGHADRQRVRAWPYGTIIKVESSKIATWLCSCGDFQGGACTAEYSLLL